MYYSNYIESAHIRPIYASSLRMIYGYFQLICPNHVTDSLSWMDPHPEIQPVSMRASSRLKEDERK